MAAISTITTATEIAATIAPLPAPLAAAYRARAQPQPRRPIGMASPLIHTWKLPHSTPRQAAGDRYESLPGCGECVPRTSAQTADRPPGRVPIARPIGPAYGRGGSAHSAHSAHSTHSAQGGRPG